MFNSTKNSDIKENTEQLVDDVKTRASKVAKEARSAATKIGRRAGSAGKQTRQEAVALLDTLRDILDPRETSSKIEQITEAVIDNFADWKDVAQNEITHAYKSGKIQSRRFIHKRTLLALSLAVGTGALIGYLASGSSDNES
jgi:hypothetical protein